MRMKWLNENTGSVLINKRLKPALHTCLRAQAIDAYETVLAGYQSQKWGGRVTRCLDPR